MAEILPKRDGNQHWLPVAGVLFLSLLVYSAVASPVPGINEPHYLAKAKHYWNPDWIAGDLFLESGNAHVVFYQAVGWLTLWLPLEQTAWVGRIAALLLLAVGWTSCLSILVPRRWASLWIVWGFLGLMSVGSFSGEWIVGGVEGKVFAYGFLFWALGWWFRQRPILAAACAGLAVSFHPVVGVWGLVAAVLDSSIVFAIQQTSPKRERGNSSRLALRTGRDRVVVALMMFVLCALPGLIPAVQLLRTPSSFEVEYQANYIQVYYRLGHHLNPREFPAGAYAWYGVLLVLWLAGLPAVTKSRAGRLLTGLVAGSALIAAGGLIVGWLPIGPAQQSWHHWQLTVLKFYPFRLFDALLPLGVAVGGVAWLSGRPNEKIARWLPGLVGGIAFVAALMASTDTRNPSRMPPQQKADWIDACRWIDRHLPTEILVRTPRDAWAFKWYAQRPEYVSFKDCPQDAAGIIEWHRRRVFIAEWLTSHYADQRFSRDELRDLRAETGITHLLTDRLGPIELEPIYRNRTYKVYELPSAR